VLADALLEGLNPEQQEAVRTTEGPLLVLAGAGSGKTRVLTNRVAWLIGVCGIAPEAILAVTFTNKAAGEMRERVQKLLGEGARGVWLSTFHSSCVRILRHEIGHLGRSRGFVIYDEDDALSVVREALRRHGQDPKEEARRLRWRIDQWKNAGLLPAAAAERAEDFESEESAEVYATYQRLLAEANALDFGDLLLLTVELFDRFPAVLRHYQERWQYVLVDEYQDTNRVQYRLVNQLAAGHRNLCVVGDPNQSIYAWRGADVRNILDFERDFPDVKVVALHRNYRSTQRILSGAGSVVENNPGRPPKRMVTDRGEGDRIRVYAARDDRDEAQFVVRGILDAVRERGQSYGQCAVFYRTNAQSRSIEEALLEYDVPYVVVGGVRFYERAEVKDALSYLRLLVNPADASAALRIVNRAARGIEEPGRAGGAVRSFVALIDSLAGELAHALPADAIARVLDRSGYLRALEAEGTPEAETRLENLRELMLGAEDFAAANAGESDDRTTLEQFLDQVALVSDLDSAELRNDRVSLMTVHSAKGLEFDVVFVVGLEEGVLPHQNASRDPRAVEEERRLCYVAMTRARQHLTLTWAHERRRWGSRSFGTPSRFLAEIPPALVERLGAPSWDAQAREDRPAYDYSYDQSRGAGGGSEGGIARGMRVRHPIFGAGTVLEVSGSGPGQALRIRFDRAGVKKIIVRYANLELG
jgi:DNA helicase-2/ATP-dependent DNA helicase PcrA